MTSASTLASSKVRAAAERLGGDHRVEDRGRAHQQLLPQRVGSEQDPVADPEAAPAVHPGRQHEVTVPGGAERSGRVGADNQRSAGSRRCAPAGRARRHSPRTSCRSDHRRAIEFADASRLERRGDAVVVLVTTATSTPCSRSSCQRSKIVPPGPSVPCESGRSLSSTSMTTPTVRGAGCCGELRLVRSMSRAQAARRPPLRQRSASLDHHTGVRDTAHHLDRSAHERKRGTGKGGGRQRR